MTDQQGATRIVEAFEQEGRTRTLALLIQAAHATQKAIPAAGWEPGRRRALLDQYDDQCVQIAKHTAIGVIYIKYFIEGQEPTIARRIAKRVGAGVVNPLGYSIKETVE